MSSAWIFEVIGGVQPGTFRSPGPNNEPDFYKDDGQGNVVDPSGLVVGYIEYATGGYGIVGTDEALQKAIAPNGQVRL